MPKRDGTGPAGKGPAAETGAGARRGHAHGQSAESGKGSGCKSGKGHAFRSMSHAMKPSRRGHLGRPSSAEENEATLDDKDDLIRQANCLEGQLEQIKKRLSQ